MRYFNCADQLLFGVFLFSTLSVCSQDVVLPEPWSLADTSGYVYDTALDYKDNHFSGLLVVKWSGDSPQVVLISKFGYTLMDFVLTWEGIEWKKKPPGRERKSLLKNMEKDFRLLLLTPLCHPEKVKSKGRNRYNVDADMRIQIELSSDEKRVISAESRGFFNLFKSFATYAYEGTIPSPSTIQLTRRLVNVEITMRQIIQ